MRILNRKAKRDYQLLEKFEAGIVLTGGEVKSLSEGRAALDDAFVKIINTEAYLINSYIYPYEFTKDSKDDPRRLRKLLLHKKEILSIKNKIQQKRLTLIPLVLYERKRKVKLEFALAKGKQVHEKKEAIKKRDLEMELAQEIAGNLKNKP